MVQSKNILFVALPTLALAGPSFHQRRHAHHHHQQRALTTVMETTYVATTTVTWGHLPSDKPKAEEPKAEENEVKADVADVQAQGERPHHGRPSSDPVSVIVSASPVAPTPTKEAPAPVVEEPTTQPTTSTKVAEPTKPSSTAAASKPTDTTPEPSYSGGNGTGGQFSIQNNCAYDLTMTIDRTQCGPIEKDIAIKAGSAWSGDITSCNGANPSYKIYKEGEGKPLQLEAGYKPDQSTLWYNISPKDCVDDMYGAGIANCPGGPWFLQAKSTAANPGACQTYQCHDAESCCTSSTGAYCDAWATAAKALGGLEPVGGCLGEVSQISLVASLC